MVSGMITLQPVFAFFLSTILSLIKQKQNKNTGTDSLELMVCGVMI